jgi:hypothetical protein
MSTQRKRGTPRTKAVPRARTSDAPTHEPDPATEPVAARARRDRLRERLRRRFH